MLTRSADRTVPARSGEGEGSRVHHGARRAGESTRGDPRIGAPPAPVTAWTPAFIVLAEELHPNYLFFFGVAIADIPRVRGTSPRDIGRNQLQVGTRCPLSSRKG